jgi:flavodoxin
MHRFLLPFIALAAFLAFTAAPSPAGSGTALADTPSGGKGVLVVYLSRSGNTKAVADVIVAATGADVFEIRPKEPYLEDYTEMTEKAKEDKNNQVRPEINGPLPDLSKYSTIVLGYPIWWGDLPTPVYTFIESLNFEGKTVAPFCTSGGSGLSETDETLAARLRGANLVQGLSVPASKAKTSETEIKAWLMEFGITK